MEVEALKWALENGGIVGSAFGIIVVSVGIYMRFRPSSPPDVTNAALGERVDAIDRRLARVESDIEHLPTRKEMHEMQIDITRLQTELKAIAKTTGETRAGITRIEGILIDLGSK